MPGRATVVQSRQPLRREVDFLPREPFLGPAHSLVLLHLVSGRPDSLLRSRPPHLGHQLRSVRADRFCPLRQHRILRPGAASHRVLADGAALHDALLRLQLFGLGEGPQLFPDLLAQPIGNRSRGRNLRPVLWRELCRQKNSRPFRHNLHVILTERQRLKDLDLKTRMEDGR